MTFVTRVTQKRAILLQLFFLKRNGWKLVAPASSIKHRLAQQVNPVPNATTEWGIAWSTLHVHLSMLGNFARKKPAYSLKSTVRLMCRKEIMEGFIHLHDLLKEGHRLGLIKYCDAAFTCREQ